ncbi:MAG: hypothetical protein ACRDE5_05365, partial [Ginsengibacter sp.]
MKKTIVGFAISAMLLAACNKDQLKTVTAPDQPSIDGKWNVDTLTTYFYDSNGLREIGEHIYPAGAMDYPYRFQFNND